MENIISNITYLSLKRTLKLLGLAIHFFTGYSERKINKKKTSDLVNLLHASEIINCQSSLKIVEKK